MMDANTQEITYVNQAYATITGHSVESLQENPSSYRELVHPKDRIRVFARIQDLASFGTLDEEFRFIRADGEVRWVWAKGFPVHAEGETRWLVGTTQDITLRKQAEIKIREQLDAVEAAQEKPKHFASQLWPSARIWQWTRCLTRFYSAFRSSFPLKPATVLFVEGETDLMIAREAPRTSSQRAGCILNRPKCISSENSL